MASRSRLLNRLSGCVLAVALLAPLQARASEVDRLIDLLVKKKVLTQEEAATFREEAKRDQNLEANPPAVAEPLEKAAKATPSGSAQAMTEKQNPATGKKEFPVTAASRIKVSGYMQTRYTNGAGTTNPFEFRRARVGVEGTLARGASFKVLVDAVRSPALIDARLDYAIRPYAKLSVGQFKIPFSHENLVSSRDLIPIERSLVGNQLVPGRDNGSSGRDIGMQLGGSVARNDGRPILDYAVGVFNGSGIGRRDDNRRKDGVARLVVYPLAELSFAGNYYNGESGVTNISRERAGVEFAYTRKLYSLRGEYIWGHDGPVRKYGWYSQFAYKFRPKWEALARFDTFDPNRHTGKDVTNAYLAGVNWYLTKWVKLQANYGLVDDEARTELTNLILSQVQFQF